MSQKRRRQVDGLIQTEALAAGGFDSKGKMSLAAKGWRWSARVPLVHMGTVTASGKRKAADRKYAGEQTAMGPVPPLLHS